MGTYDKSANPTHRGKTYHSGQSGNMALMGFVMALIMMRFVTFSGLFQGHSTGQSNETKLVAILRMSMSKEIRETTEGDNTEGTNDNPNLMLCGGARIFDGR